MRQRPLLLSLFLLAGFCQAAPATLTADEAEKHTGEKATVCGVVASLHFAAHSRGTATFVNLDKPYRKHVFTILIWGDDMPKFYARLDSWVSKRVCATGKITSYRGENAGTDRR